MKPFRFYRLTASSWRRLALAPAAMFAVGVLHAQTVSNHTTTTATNTVKLPEPVTLLSFDEGTGTYAADSVGDHPAESESQWQLRIQFRALFRNGFGNRDQVI